jgi:hypothetical protein
MKTNILFFPLFLFCIFLGESFSQEKLKIYIEADSLTKERIDNYLEQYLKENPKVRYEILRIKPPPNVDYKILYAYIDTTIDYKILVYTPPKKLNEIEIKKYFWKVIPDSLIKPRK